MADYSARRAAFRALHESGCFVIPNPWDAGSAKYLKSLGFKALATTSAGLAFSKGLPDNPDKLPRELVLEHLAEIVNATNLPVNADFQSGYAKDAEGVAESVRLCVATGVAGLSIEDSTNDAQRPLFEVSEAVERIRAARASIDATARDVMLVGRSECFLVGRPDLGETIKRLRAYSDAGADVLYAPRISSLDQLRAIVEAVAPRPVNALVTADFRPDVSELAAIGVRRISVGGGLARVAWGGLMRAATAMAEGNFDGLVGAPSHAQMDKLFGG
jgi:2-methylisocitrate lyase-like PEP mutase family enzyme